MKWVFRIGQRGTRKTPGKSFSGLQVFRLRLSALGIWSFRFGNLGAWGLGPSAFLSVCSRFFWLSAHLAFSLLVSYLCSDVALCFLIIPLLFAELVYGHPLSSLLSSNVFSDSLCLGSVSPSCPEPNIPPLRLHVRDARRPEMSLGCLVPRHLRLDIALSSLQQQEP